MQDQWYEYARLLGDGGQFGEIAWIRVPILRSKGMPSFGTEEQASPERQQEAARTRHLPHS